MRISNLKKTVFVLTILITFLCACSEKSKAEPIAPFSNASWSCSVEEMITMEGENYSTYDSVYNGTTYAYEKEFEGYEGIVKYMYNEDKQLMRIAWLYNRGSEEEIHNLYQYICQSVNEKYGESSYTADSHSSNYGNVWRLDSGNIVLTAIITPENKALQYAYFNPLVSTINTKID